MYLASVGELNISKSLDSDHNASSKAELTNILPVEGRISNSILVFRHLVLTYYVLQHLSY